MRCLRGSVRLSNFYPRPPRGGRLVQSVTIPSPIDFYPRPPRGGRRYAPFRRHSPFQISIHALREEGDGQGWQSYNIRGLFLSTPSARRATDGSRVNDPCGVFLSTPSARRATMTCLREMRARHNFYPRPPRGGRPLLRPNTRALVVNFYPRPPRGGRQQKQRENPLLLSHYTPLCTNCKEVPVKQTAKSHRYLCKRLVFRCEASGKTMCAAYSHWRGIKRSAHYPAQTPGAAQHARP